jgi:hypothetical protein
LEEKVEKSKLDMKVISRLSLSLSFVSEGV